MLPAAAGFALAASLALLRPAVVRAGRVGIFFHGSLQSWLTNTEAGSDVEAALYRVMALPTGDVLYPRSPRETRPALAELLKAGGGQSALYSLRALEDEQALDFAAAEADWKMWAEHAPDRAAAELDLADFYGRRLRPQDEIAALMLVAEAPAAGDEAFTAPSQQRSWKAFARILRVVENHALGADVGDRTWRAWIARYPALAEVYSQYFDALVQQKRYDDAAALVAEYSRAFPADRVFPIQAQASLAYQRGSIADGLAVYDKSFDPLWPAELVQGYFDLLKSTHSLSAFVDHTRARLSADPDDLDAATRLFYAYQQQGRLDAAKQVIADFRRSREARGAQWKAQELYTLAKLLEGVQAYPESARYSYALYNSQGMPDAQQRALAGLIGILFDAPEQPVRLGAGNLSMYRDIATMDQGPGYLNGILSLLLNTTDPSGEYASEDRLATPYFHRAEGAALLSQLDRRFPDAPERAALHAKLIAAYGVYGENDAVIRAGDEFLAQFPKDSRRVDVALTVADACARTSRTEQEFTIYDQLLRELAAQAGGVPLGDGTARYSKPVSSQAQAARLPSGPGTAGDGTAGEGMAGAAMPATQQAFVTQGATAESSDARSAQYQQVLDRYLARLVSMQQLPRALAVLRGEVEHDPNDPGIYEKLAQFLDQNQLGEHEAEVYRRAIQQFDETGWYAKLARFYLRQKRDAEYGSLTAQVTKIFSGTELEAYFAAAPAPGAELSLEVNLYAHKRFPHDLRFTENLLSLYRSRPTHDAAAWEELLSEHWFENASLRNEFFEHLMQTSGLAAALARLRTQNDEIAQSNWPALAARNPAAAQWLVEADLWQSHFEECAPTAGALAEEYPSSGKLGDQAVSLYRSLAYFDSADTDRAAAIEKRLVSAEPGDLDRLARMGDIYADRERFADAAPYWFEMADVRPGEAGGYLQSATVFWDYFDFDHALAQLEKGRHKLGKPDLYSYEEGAIYENKRDYTKAIAEYVRGASADSQSRERLVALARRKDHAAQVYTAVAPIVLKTNPTQDEISLLVDVLNAEQRKADLSSALDGMLDRSTSFDTLAFIAQVAAQQSLVAVQGHSLERQIAITTDPVRRMGLRYDLAHFYESNGNAAAAQSTIDALYRENPKVLGVVRATVDYVWAHDRRQLAVTVLQGAAGSAYPSLGRQLSFEAARKLTDLGRYAEARSVLNTLLAASPFDGSYLEAVADTYGREGDNAGLRDFYQTQIAGLKAAQVPDKTARMAALRRGLIPALTRLNESSTAIDQYIELMDAYPDDSGLSSEAALYAARYQQQPKLLDFYRKAVADSPRDARWPVLLARLETTLEDYPAAIDAYAKAIAIRPDRADLYTARAGLNEKLQHYDAAVADYEKLYGLSYHDPQWMEQAAEAYARQGKADLAVGALKTALIDGKPAKAANYFDVARRLEAWNMLEPASSFAQKGAELAGDDLLADGSNHAGAVGYARIFTRLRKTDAAYARLADALAAAGKAPGLTATISRVEEQGVAAVTDDQWREQQRTVRLEAGREGFAAALREMATAARAYYTPEETQGFAELLRTKSAGASEGDRRAFYLIAAVAGGLTDLQAELAWQDAAGSGRNAGGEWAAWVQLQRSRLLLGASAKQLEAYAPSVATARRKTIYREAASLYRDSGDEAAELRMLSDMGALSETDGGLRERYFVLLLAQQPDKLTALAGSGSASARDAATQYAILHAPNSLALEAVRDRGRGLDPVWTSSYTGLAGLYLRQLDASTGNAFLSALGDATIGERIAKPADRTTELAGDVWFYYGARYGEYLGLAGSADSEEFLPATMEARPESGAAYEELAAWYGEHGSADRAIEEYSLALQLNSGDATIYDKRALLLWGAGKRDEALADWQTAVTLLVKQIDLRRVPDSFWPDFAAVTGHLGERREFTAVRPQVDAMLRSYIRRNAGYMVEPLLHAVYTADGSVEDATAWLLQLAALSNPPDAVLNAVVGARWIPASQRPRFYARLVELAGESAGSSEGEARAQAQDLLRPMRVQWIESLMKAGDYAQAKAVFESVPAEDKKRYEAMWVPVALELAAHEGTLGATVAQWRQNPVEAPPVDVLRSAIAALDPASKELVLSFVYESAIAASDLSAANFLGLAEIRIHGGDIAGAVALLQRMTLVSADRYTDLASAASLLVRSGHDADAIPFFVQLVNGVPWEAAYRLQLDAARMKANQQQSAALADLVTLASSDKAAYAIRTEAAQTLAGKRAAANLGSEELNLLAIGKISAEAARKPFFFAARLAAAKTTGTLTTGTLTTGTVTTGTLTTGTLRIALLKEAVAMRPESDAARIALLEAAIGAKDSHLVVNAAAPLLGEVSYGTEEGDDNGADEADVDATRWSAGLAASLNGLPAPERAQVLTGVADAYRQIGEDNAALGRYFQAWHLDDDAARRRRLTTEIRDVRATIARRTANEQRAPVIHKTTDQNHPVRPRLLASAARREP
jgi:tetratricopeptide (TPR) repeat protein